MALTLESTRTHKRKVYDDSIRLVRQPKFDRLGNRSFWAHRSFVTGSCKSSPDDCIWIQGCDQSPRPIVCSVFAIIIRFLLGVAPAFGELKGCRVFLSHGLQLILKQLTSVTLVIDTMWVGQLPWEHREILYGELREQARTYLAQSNQLRLWSFEEPSPVVGFSHSPHICLNFFAQFRIL